MGTVRTEPDFGSIEGASSTPVPVPGFDNTATGAKVPKRTELLRNAANIINGARQNTYGDATEDFTRTGKLWEQILGTPVSAWQVAICLGMVKVSRLVATSGAHEDSWTDLAGYTALGGEIGIPDRPLGSANV